MNRRFATLTLALLLACTSGGGHVGEIVSSTSSAIGNGVVDSANPDGSNTTVKLVFNITGSGGLQVRPCSGIFVTPTRILTAAHCANGDTDDPRTANLASIGVGFAGAPPPAPFVGATLGAPPKGVVTLASGTVTSPVNDVAIVSLDTVQLNAQPTTYQSILGLRIRRPLNSPPVDTTSAAGFGTQDYRRSAVFSPATQLVGYWRYTDYNPVAANRIFTSPGDSGGPLYVTRSDGRAAIGIASRGSTGSGTNSDFSDFADLTYGPTVSWLASKLVDSSRPAGSNGPRWFGEVDYLGQCQSGDVDCDHVYDGNDNCPQNFNPGQEDGDGDGHGDACPCPCDPAHGFTDALDNDGVCAVACPGFVADNCPVTKNADQSNCNSRSEGIQNRSVLGDVCDPVPCPATTAEQTSSAPGTCTGNAQIGGVCWGRRIRDRLDTLPIQSHYLDNSSPTNGVIPPDAIPTHFRFCQSNVGALFRCDDSVAVDDAQLSFPETANDRTRPWHRVSFGSDPVATSYPWTYGAQDSLDQTMSTSAPTTPTAGRTAARGS